MAGTSSRQNNKPVEWSQPALFSESPFDSSASNAPPPSSCEPPVVSEYQQLRLKRGVLGQTIVMTRLGETFTAEVVKLSRRLDGTPSILLRKVVDEPAAPINIGGVLLPAEAIWLVGWDACRRFIDTRHCPLLETNSVLRAHHEQLRQEPA